MASDIGKQRLGQVKQTNQCISLFLIQDTLQKSLCFPNVSEFVWIYLQFYVTTSSAGRLLYYASDPFSVLFYGV